MDEQYEIDDMGIKYKGKYIYTLEEYMSVQKMDTE